jgi:hypothetical protein
MSDLGRHVRIKLDVRGKAPRRRYGENVYQVGHSIVDLLTSRNWVIVKNGTYYSYMRPPEDAGPTPLIIDAIIPQEEAVKRMANEWHQKGVLHTEKVGDWIAHYTPAGALELETVDLIGLDEDRSAR